MCQDLCVAGVTLLDYEKKSMDDELKLEGPKRWKCIQIAAGQLEVLKKKKSEVLLSVDNM